MIVGFVLSGIALALGPAEVGASVNITEPKPIVTQVQNEENKTSALKNLVTKFSVEVAPEKEPDLRAAGIDAYFEKRNMPLAGYGQKFVEEADKCGDIDYRLLAAIGVRESSGGKHLMNNNPFGWGSARIPFTDFDHAIEEVTKHLCGKYENTARYYGNKTTYQRLWAYNGTVMPSYPDEVIAIMNKM